MELIIGENTGSGIATPKDKYNGATATKIQIGKDGHAYATSDNGWTYTDLGKWSYAKGESKPASSGSYGSSGSSSNASDSTTGSGAFSYQDYLNAANEARRQAIESANEARRQAIESANNALDQQGRSNEQRYNNQLTQIGQDYQGLKNQSEVNRYKALRSLRETQANRGTLDSGDGRQENLTVSNNYGNNLNKINLSEQNEKDSIAQAIADMWANINAQKATNEASTLDSYNSTLQSMLNGIGTDAYSYNPSASDYYNVATETAGTTGGVGNAVGNGKYQLTDAQIAAAMNNSSDDYGVKNYNMPSVKNTTTVNKKTSSPLYYKQTSPYYNY